MKVGMKKATGFMMALALLTGAVTGCSGASAQSGSSGGTRYISIATSSSG